jgi:hypothetical protein
MNSEELELIYNYLHDNYEYKDGDLFHKFDLLNKSKLKGDKLGSFFSNTSRPYMATSLRINKKKYCLKLIKFIYIYHHKYLPSRLYQIDGNPMNTRIENLEASTQTIIQHKSNSYKNFNAPKVINKDGTEGYSVRTHYLGKILDLGTYRTAQIAKEVYKEAKDLILNSDLNCEEIKKKIAIMFPESSLNIISKHGFKGVSKSHNKYLANIRIPGKRIYLGSFDTAKEASKAYLAAEKLYKKS